MTAMKPVVDSLGPPELLWKTQKPPGLHDEAQATEAWRRQASRPVGWVVPGRFPALMGWAFSDAHLAESFLIML